MVTNHQKLVTILENAKFLTEITDLNAGPILMSKMFPFLQKLEEISEFARVVVMF